MEGFYFIRGQVLLGADDLALHLSNLALKLHSLEKADLRASVIGGGASSAVCHVTITR